MNVLLIGKPNQFAIESCISCAYSKLSLRGLGYFLLHVNNYCYGVRSDNATMLACSLDEVKRRVLSRGTHTAPFSNNLDANLIALAVYNSIYSPEEPNTFLGGLSALHVRKLVYSNQLQWAPDGDEAFDDGSRVLHFDIGNRVRIIGYKIESDEKGFYRTDPSTLKDQWIDADEFYCVLESWRDAFEVEWRNALINAGEMPT